MLRLLRLFIATFSLVYHLLLPCLLIHDLFVLQIYVEHDQLLILADEVLRLVSRYVNAKRIV